MFHRMSRLVLASVFAIGAATLPALPADRRVALVIGNATYENTTALINPEADSADVAAVLRTFGFEVIEGRNLDKPAMDRTIRNFAKALVGASAGLFYYAGHGLQVGGQNYLVPVDAKLDTSAALDFEAVRFDLIQRTMERETKVNLLFLDACRDNPLAKNLARAFGTRSAQVGRGLAAIESGEGTLISFSTQPGNVAFDGPGRNSPYAAALKKHMPNAGDDLSSILINVRNDVMQATTGRQVPWEHSALTSRFFFSKPPSKPPSEAQPQAAPPADHQAELLFWATVKDSKDPAMLQSYLDRYPAGTFSGIARIMQRQLSPEQSAPRALPTETAALSKADQEPASSAREPSTELVRKLQSELKRVGCDPGRVDGKWGSKAGTALASFAQHGNVTLAAKEEPSAAALDAVSSKKERVCPLECAANEVESEGQCVSRRTSARSKPKRRPEAAAPERKRSVERRPEPRKTVERKPAPRKYVERRQASSAKPSRPENQGSKKMCWSQGKMVLVRCDDPTALR